MNKLSSPRIIETCEREVVKKTITCTSCKYIYEEIDVYVIPRLRKVISRVKNGIEIADKEKLESAEIFYKNHGYLDAYYMKYVKLSGKYTKGEPIFEKKQRLYGSKDKFQIYRFKNEKTGEYEHFYKCPICGTMIAAEKALNFNRIRENAEEIDRSERTHVLIDD